MVWQVNIYGFTLQLRVGDTCQIFKQSHTFVQHKKCQLSMEHVFALHMRPILLEVFAHVLLGFTMILQVAHNVPKIIYAKMQIKCNNALHYRLLQQERMIDAFAARTH
jgi:hypothetical protein